MQPIDQVVAALNADPTGPNQWQARCPAHDDRQASLSVGQAADGRVLLNCHAGCRTDDVVHAAGLRMTQLFPKPKIDLEERLPPPPSHKPHIKVKPPKPIPKPSTPVSLNTAAMKVGTRLDANENKRWVYCNTDGREVAAVVRYTTSSGKTYRPFRKDGPAWREGGIAEDRPLYRVNDIVLHDGLVFVVEGEKSADAAGELGFMTTTSMHGAESPSKTDWSPLAGREVVVLPDHDAAGKKYAEKVASILAGLSPPARVKVVELPGLPEHGDIVEFIAARADRSPQEIYTELQRLAEQTDWVKSLKVPTSRRSEVNLVSASDIEPVEVRWLWPGRVPLGRMTLLVGRPGDGKSFLTAYLAAQVSRGRDWIDGTSCPIGSVVLCSAEDDPADTIVPRLIAQDADRSHVKLLTGVTEAGRSHERVFTLADVEPLREKLDQLKGCRLIVVDPIGSYLGGKTDAHRDNDVRSVLAPVAQLAASHDAALVVVAHTRKSAAAFADDTAMGSRAFTGLARSVQHLMIDPDDESRKKRLLLPGKNNLGGMMPGLAFDIGVTPGVDGCFPSILWRKEEVTITADEAIHREPSGSGQKPTRDEAIDVLQDLLADGPRPTKDVEEEARERFGIAKRTLERARKALGVVAFQDKKPGPWWLQLPNREPDRQPALVT